MDCGDIYLQEFSIEDADNKYRISNLNAVAIINNVPSNKVIEKCGFTYLSQKSIDNEQYNHYILSKPE
ncbi:hypothetical protein MOJ78_16485 [Alkalihalobacillus sp. AL-G]|nr:hypothetical protein [Alkalihalobacillus sp. AL-G]WLD95450.1 hypothetical protein MOJ78_16485 [Alkalihalobacillus sp. AL-G]